MSCKRQSVLPMDGWLATGSNDNTVGAVVGSLLSSCAKQGNDMQLRRLTVSYASAAVALLLGAPFNALLCAMGTPLLPYCGLGERRFCRTVIYGSAVIGLLWAMEAPLLPYCGLWERRYCLTVG